MLLDGVVRRGRGYGPRQPELIQGIEQLERARLQLEARLRDCPEMSDPRRQKVVHGKICPEMREEQAPALTPRQADRLVEHRQSNRVPSFCRGEDARLLVKSFGVEEQAVHVEDDG